MSLLISPKLIPSLYHYNKEDEQVKNWTESSPSDPVCFWSDFSGTLRVEGEGLCEQLIDIATIYHEVDGDKDAKIRAVPRELLAVNATTEAGCLREDEWDGRQGGLIFQTNETTFSSSGLVALTEGKLSHYSICLFELYGDVVGYERDYTYGDMVRREFKPFYN